VLTLIARRLVWCVVVMFFITVFVFILYFVMTPVSPALLFAGKSATPSQIEAAKVALGLNHSVPEQYYLFVKHLVLGDQYGWPGFGFSFTNRQSVLSLIGPRIVVTLTLGIGALLIWLALGITVGTIAAVRRNGHWDRVSLGVSMLLLSAPPFWLALVFLWLFWFKLGIAPGSGYYSIGSYGFGSWLSHMIMPWLVLALLYAAWYARMTRGAVLDVLNRDFVLTARGKGLTEHRVLFRHVLRAALTPMLTMVGMDIAGLISGAVVVEYVFNLNGLGQFALNSVLNDDIPSVLAVTLIGTLAVTIGNLIVDVLYVYADPRIRTSVGSRVDFT
jgi:peptide/nickel transport system permease protein